MVTQRWWGRSRGLPVPTYEVWRISLTASPGRSARILAWARTRTGFCVGSPAALSIGADDGFSHIGWHEIERGGWNAETSRLSWVCYPSEDGRARRGYAELVAPARLPELFRERVAASIVFERFVPLTSVGGGGGVTVSARRDLAGAADRIRWHASPSRGVDWRSEDVRAEADRLLERMRTEYDGASADW